MKKIVLSTIGAFFMTAAMMSCNQPKETEVSPTTAKAGEEPTSVIDQMEKEEGVKFFKRDVTLIDESGKNTVVMRFATLKKDALDAYLASHEYEIVPRHNVSKSISGNFSSNTLLNKKEYEEYPNLGRERIITEILSQSLENKVINYSIRVKVKSLNNARTTSTYAYSETHTTPKNWPEELIITVFGLPSCGFTDVLYGIDYKNTWASSWYSLDNKPWDNYKVVAPSDLYSGFPCNHPLRNGVRSHNVDGPWRVRFNIQHNGNYEFEWINP